MTEKKSKYAMIDDDLDEEEREIEAALVRGDYQRAPDLPERIRKWEEAVANTRRKKPITVRVQVGDIERMRVKAMELGLPYQTLLSSIIHQYASGRLVMKE
jgi:predicted DNA binding CopG/RHH family protein